jgi:hypothetical protein
MSKICFGRDEVVKCIIQVGETGRQTLSQGCKFQVITTDAGKRKQFTVEYRYQIVFNDLAIR